MRLTKWSDLSYAKPQNFKIPCRPGECALGLGDTSAQHKEAQRGFRAIARGVRRYRALLLAPGASARNLRCVAGIHAATGVPAKISRISKKGGVLWATGGEVSQG